VDYGTGALGDMGCHLIEAPFRVLGLGYPTEATCSVSSYYTGPFRRGYFPEVRLRIHVTLKFGNKKSKEHNHIALDGWRYSARTP